MNRDDTIYAIETMQAHADGKEDVWGYQRSAPQEPFYVGTNPVWNWDTFHYYIKPKPREFWMESVGDHKNRHYVIHVAKDSSEPNNEFWIKVREVIE